MVYVIDGSLSGVLPLDEAGQGGQDLRKTERNGSATVDGTVDKRSNWH